MCLEFKVDYLQISLKARNCSTILHIRDAWIKSYISLKKNPLITLWKERSFASKINDLYSVRVHHARWHASEGKFPCNSRNIVASKTYGKTNGNKTYVKANFTCEFAILHTRKSRTKREAALWMKRE